MKGFLARNAALAGLLVAYLLLVAVVSVATGMVFLRPQNLLDVLQQTSIVFMVAAGMTCVIIMGEIDLAVGSLISVASCVFGYLVTVREWGVLPAALPVLALGLIGAAVTAGLRTRYRIPSFITSLAFLSIWRGAAYLLTDGMPFYGFPDSFEELGWGTVFRVPVVVLMAAALFFLINFLLEHTALGRSVYALGGNEKSAILSGVPVARVRLAVFVLLGLLTAFTGLVQSARLMAAPPTVGEGWEMIIIASVIVGGTSMNGGVGVLAGTFLGALFIETLENGLIIMGVNPFTQLVMRGLVIVVAVWVNAMQRYGARGLLRGGET